MIAGFGFKVALVPFQMWTPDVYQGAPTSVTAFMSVGAKAAGFAALGRVAIYAFGHVQGDWVWVLAVLAALTMTVGNLAALRQTNLKRMLAYAGFLGKLYVFSAAVQADLTWLAIFGVINSVVSAYYYLRVVAAMYMKEGTAKPAASPVCLALQVGAGLAAVATLVLGVWPAPIMNLANVAIAALLGG